MSCLAARVVRPMIESVSRHRYGCERARVATVATSSTNLTSSERRASEDDFYKQGTYRTAHSINRRLVGVAGPVHVIR